MPDSPAFHMIACIGPVGRVRGSPPGRSHYRIPVCQVEYRALMRTLSIVCICRFRTYVLKSTCCIRSRQFLVGTLLVFLNATIAHATPGLATAYDEQVVPESYRIEVDGDPDVYQYHPELALTFGRGFSPNDLTERKLPCLKYETQKIDAGPVNAEIFFQLHYNRDSLNLSAELDYKVDVSILKNTATAGFDTELGFQHEHGMQRVIAVLRAEIDYGRWGLTPDIRLTDYAQGLIDSGKHAEFARTCGTRYVSEERRAVAIEVTVILSSMDTRTVADLAGEFKAGVPFKAPLKVSQKQKLAGALDVVSKLDHLTVNVRAVGGGDPEAYSDTIEATIEEKLRSSDPIDGIWKLIRGSLKQLDKGGAATVAYGVASMEHFGWKPDGIDPWTDWHEEELRRITMQYRDTLDDLVIARQIESGEHALNEMAGLPGIPRWWVREIVNSIVPMERQLEALARGHRACKESRDCDTSGTDYVPEHVLKKVADLRATCILKSDVAQIVNASSGYFPDGEASNSLFATGKRMVAIDDQLVFNWFVVPKSGFSIYVSRDELGDGGVLELVARRSIILGPLEIVADGGAGNRGDFGRDGESFQRRKNLRFFVGGEEDRVSGEGGGIGGDGGSGGSGGKITLNMGFVSCSGNNEIPSISQQIANVRVDVSGGRGGIGGRGGRGGDGKFAVCGAVGAGRPAGHGGDGGDGGAGGIGGAGGRVTLEFHGAIETVGVLSVMRNRVDTSGGMPGRGGVRGEYGSGGDGTWCPLGGKYGDGERGRFGQRGAWGIEGSRGDAFFYDGTVYRPIFRDG